MKGRVEAGPCHLSPPKSVCRLAWAARPRSLQHRLEHSAEHGLQAFGIEVTDDTAVVGDGDGATFLRDDDDDGIALFRHADGGSVAQSQLSVRQEGG